MGIVVDTAYTHRARAAGLTEPLIRQVIDAFYVKVRRDAALGPVFDAIIKDHWPAHIERICAFWLTATRLGSGYEGRAFMPAHLRHVSIRPELLPQWLVLFRQTARATCAHALPQTFSSTSLNAWRSRSGSASPNEMGILARTGAVAPRIH
jgi:hemoglobin